jgi:hypothetical protein
LRRRYELIEGARLANDRRHLGRGFDEHLDFLTAKGPRLDCLNNQDALENAALDKRNAKKRLVLIFARLAEVFETWMIPRSFHCDRPDLFRNEARKTLVQCETKNPDALVTKSKSRSQHEVGAIRF